jgi:hypothetical protein
MQTASTVEDIDDILDEIASSIENDNFNTPWTIPEINRAADDLGLSATKYLKGKSLAESLLAARVRAAHTLLTSTVDEVGVIKSKIDREGLTAANSMNLAGKLSVLHAVYSRFDQDSSEVARALRILREVSSSRRALKDIAKYMDESHSTVGSMSDVDLMNLVDAVAKGESPARAAQVVLKAASKHWEDYVGSIYYNAMLSSPITWFKNFFGTPMNFLNDLVVDSTASAVTKTMPVNERIVSAEIAARVTGALGALANYKTYRNIYDAFVTGQTSIPGFERKVGQRGPIFPRPSQVKGGIKKSAAVVGSTLETPMRIMAATDELWSNLFFISNLNGTIVREAFKEVNKTQLPADLIAEWTKDPPKRIIDMAVGITNRQLFRDTPSGVAAAILKLQTPRYVGETEITLGTDPVTGKQKALSYNRKNPDGQIVRGLKFITSLLVPFVSTLDSIARTIIRNSGPTALFSSEIRRDLMSGGIKRQSALARISVATAFMTVIAAMAADDRLTGIEEGDYKEAGARGAVRPPMSIKIGDEWHSYAGYDPIAGQIAAASTMVERYKRNSEYPIVDAVQGMVAGMAGALIQSSYAESVSNFIELVLEGKEAITEGRDAGPIVQNTLVGTATIPLNPNFVRWYNQEFLDTAQRDATADNTISGRITDRVRAAWPGFSQGLPQVFDPFGRPVSNMRQPRNVETDPAVLEINRLEREHEGLVMGRPPKTIRINGEDRKLNSEEYQAYQEYTGYYALEDIRNMMSYPEWGEASDEDRIRWIKETLRDVRAEGRRALFGEQDLQGTEED